MSSSRHHDCPNNVLLCRLYIMCSARMKRNEAQVKAISQSQSMVFVIDIN